MRKTGLKLVLWFAYRVSRFAFLMSAVLIGLTVIAPRYVSLRDWGDYVVGPGVISQHYCTGGCGHIDDWLNIWLWMIPSAVATVFFWTASLPTPPINICDLCEYDLTGNVSGRCPECGTPTGAPATS